jgi:hypothetical protein
MNSKRRSPLSSHLKSHLSHARKTSAENELQTTIFKKNSRIHMLEQACNSRHILFSEQLDRTKKERDSSTAELTDMINRLQSELRQSNRLCQESGEIAKSTFADLNKAH